MDIRQRIIELTQALVDIPTENVPPHGNEKRGQDYIKNILHGLGCEIVEFPPSAVPGFKTNDAFIVGNIYEDRNNILGYIKGSGGGRSLILNGHMDVAPKEPMCWTKCKPFESVVIGDKIYGRGTADMKGGLVCGLVAMEMLREEGFQPKGDVIFQSVVDEEYASSAGSLATMMLGHTADFGIILEPTGLDICPACVGSIILKVTLEGVAGMPYTGEVVVNPVYMLGEVTGLIKEYDRQRLQNIQTPPLWKDTPQAAQIIITKAKSGEVQPNGQLSTPMDAWVELVIQTYPGEKIDEISTHFESFLRSRFSQPDKLTVEREYHYCKPASESEDTQGLDLFKKVADTHTDRAKVCGAMFSCDLFAFEEYRNYAGDRVWTHWRKIAWSRRMGQYRQSGDGDRNSA